MGELVYLALILLLPIGLVTVVVLKRRRLRNFAWFRVVDGKTGQPLAGYEVLRVGGSQDKMQTMGGGAGATVLRSPGRSWSRVIGTLDANGELRGIFGHNTGAFSVRGATVLRGLIGTESVSHYLAYPSEPYVCTLHDGSITPPTKSSPLARGLPPGAVETRHEGFANLYEKPALGESVLCWPSLEAAKAANQSGTFARYWRVTGVETGPGVNGSVSIEIDSVERA